MAKSVPGNVRDCDSIAVDFRNKVVCYRSSGILGRRYYSFENNEDLVMVIKLLRVCKDFERMRRAYSNAQIYHRDSLPAHGGGKIAEYHRGETQLNHSVHPYTHGLSTLVRH